MKSDDQCTLGELGKLPVWVRLVMILVGSTLGYLYLFHHVYPTASAKSLADWTWSACNSGSGFYHGRLVFFLVPVMLGFTWKGSQNQGINPSYWGLLWMGVAFLLLWASMRVVQPRWAMFGVPFLVIGLSQCLFGWGIARSVVFPALFLWFAIPVPGLESWIATTISPLLTEASVQILPWVGVEVQRNGSALQIGGALFSFSAG